MESTVGIDQVRELLGLMVFDSANEPVGTVREVLYEEATNWPLWIGVGAAPSATSRILLPLESALIGGAGLTFPFTKDAMRRAPVVHGDFQGPQKQELRVYYGLSPRDPSGETRWLT